ncbi:MAG: hypothetical protein LBR27_06980 [Bifidobacteriaceae bacterium]|jgi:hypothetical protein|nr:hypothetical protein [Bifidobacteriaceae bacterium]
MKKIPTKIIAVIGAALLSVGVLSGCGGSKSFCDVINDDQYDDLDYNDTDAAEKALKDLKAAAPSDLKDDIDVLLDYFDAVKDIDTDDYDALLEAMESFDSDKLDEASEALDEAVAECEAD